MELDINKLEAKLIARYGKEGLEKRINNFYERNSKAISKEHARRMFIYGKSKFLAEATPSTYTPPEK